jgi:hypothetical protein
MDNFAFDFCGAIRSVIEHRFGHPEWQAGAGEFMSKLE